MKNPPKVSIRVASRKNNAYTLRHAGRSNATFALMSETSAVMMHGYLLASTEVCAPDEGIFIIATSTAQICCVQIRAQQLDVLQWYLCAIACQLS